MKDTLSKDVESKIGSNNKTRYVVASTHISTTMLLLQLYSVRFTGRCLCLVTWPHDHS